MVVCFYFSCIPSTRVVVEISCSYLQSLVKDYNNLRSKLSQQSSLKRQKPLTSTKKRPEALPLVQTMVVVRLKTITVYYHWEVGKPSLSTAGRTPNVDKSSYLLRSFAVSTGEKSETTENLDQSSSCAENRFCLVQDRCYLLQKALSSV